MHIPARPGLPGRGSAGGRRALKSRFLHGLVRGTAGARRSRVTPIDDQALAAVTGGNNMFDSPLAILAIPLIISAYSHQSTGTPIPAPARPQPQPPPPQRRSPSWP